MRIHVKYLAKAWHVLSAPNEIWQYYQRVLAICVPSTVGGSVRVTDTFRKYLYRSINVYLGPTVCKVLEKTHNSDKTGKIPTPAYILHHTCDWGDTISS